MNREAWLTAAVEALKGHMEACGYGLPPVRVSVGFPSRSALSRKVKRIGECWASECAADGVHQIFISPLLGPDRVLDVLLHELCHASVGTEEGHGAAFKRAAKAVGLIGKATATEAGEGLKATLDTFYASLGDYPHAVLVPSEGKQRKQTTRMIKVACADDDYVVRMSRATMAKGLPQCPVCARVMEAEVKEA